MFDKFKQTISDIFQRGNDNIDRVLFGEKKQENPQTTKEISNKFLSYATSKPAEYIKEGADEFIESQRYSPDKISFKSPFVADNINRPEFQEASQELSSRFKQWVSPKVDWAKKVANTTADLTYRGIVTRPIAKTALSIADAVTPGEMPSFTATDPAGKFLMGDDPLTSYQQSTKNAQGWLQDNLGLNQSTAQKLGLVAGVANVALDLPGGGLLKQGGRELAEQAVKRTVGNSIDDAINVAWKSKSARAKLKSLTTYADELISKGFSKEAVDKMSAKSGSYLLDSGMTPKAYNESAREAIKQSMGIKNFVDEFKSWVGTRQSAKWQGLLASQPFKKLDELGQSAFQLVEGGQHNQALSELRKYFDDGWKRLNDAGITTNYTENYLPHLFKETEDQASLALGRKLSKGSRFSLSRVLKDYNEGRAAGLTPRFNSIGEIVQQYEASIQKSIGDKQFFEWLKSKKLILTGTEIAEMGTKAQKLTRDWLDIDTKKFGTTFDANEAYKATAEVRNTIEGYLEDYGNQNLRQDTVAKWLKSAGSFNSRLKAHILTGGLPGTGFNAYGWIIYKRNLLASKNPLKGAKQALEYMIQPKKAQQFIDTNLAEATDAVKHGLTLDSDSFDVVPYIKKESKNWISKGYQGYEGWMSKNFEAPLFQSIIPALKLSNYRQNLNLFLKEGLDVVDAKRMASEVTNEILSGQNIDQLMKNKSTQSFLRSTFLAPEYYRSTIKVGEGVANTLLKPGSPQAKAYNIYARNMVLHRLMTEVSNKMMSGHWQFQNAVGDKNNVETNFYDSHGKKIVIKNAGTDYQAIPLDIVSGLISGDTGVVKRKLVGRTSPLIQLGVSAVYGTDYKGDKITRSTDSLSKKAGLWGAEIGKYVINPQAGATAKAVMGETSPLQAISKITEAPLYFRGGAYSDKDKSQVEIMKQGGASNEAIHDKLETQKPWNQPDKLSIEQKQRNLDEGLNINTQRNLLGKPKEPISDPTRSSLTSVNTEKVSSITELRNRANESQANTEKNALIKQIFSSLESDEQVSKALKANNISMREGISYMAKNLGVENGQRGEYLMSILETTKDKKEFEATSLEMAKSGLLTTGVTKQWRDSNTITDTQKKQLDNIIKASKGQSTSSSSSGRSSQAKGSISVKYNLPTKKFASKLPGLPKLKELQPTSTGRIVAPRLTVQSQAKPKMEKLENYN